jgi:putative endonuclease
MTGRITQLALRALDKAAKLIPGSRHQPPHLATGRRGEEEAYFYLRRRGYVIVARNFRSHRRPGEIDLVGWDGDVLCFIEVKTRTTHAIKPPEAAVDLAKQRKVRAIAREFLRRSPINPQSALPKRPKQAMGSPPHRFDILSIYLADGSHPEFALFKNAFAVS